MLCLRSQLRRRALAHLKSRIPKVLLPMSPNTRFIIPSWPSDQLQIFSLFLMTVRSRFKRSISPFIQANAEQAWRKHLFLFSAWLSGVWELARRKDSATGNRKPGVSCLDVTGYTDFWGDTFLQHQAEWQGPHPTYGGSQRAPPHKELTCLLVTSFFRFLASTALLSYRVSCLLELLHSPHCFVPGWTLP